MGYESGGCEKAIELLGSHGCKNLGCGKRSESGDGSHVGNSEVSTREGSASMTGEGSDVRNGWWDGC